ncbi:MAG: Nif11-like leader peptide family natural product precursor [Oscillospiraceae bacterium]|nr:Nif11-like leader peptide family natural product precursor [Oscillospiraceae bacterium]
MRENVGKFFERYAEDEALRRRIAEAQNNYPGSLEIREAVVEAVLLPEAAALGLDFTVQELRAYETRKKLEASRDGAVSDTDEDFEGYWLLDRGWTYDTDDLKKQGR